MNLLANPLADAKKVWNNVKGANEPRPLTAAAAAGGGAGKAGGVNAAADGAVFSFITPSIVALGKFNEKRIPELFSTLGSRKALIWNLSGKSIHPTILSKVNYQLMDVPWVTPGQFTQAPSLECVFAQCYALKSWLDLGQDHVIVVHCANGRSRTGILISCFLKYIGAFAGANAAFDFFLEKRISNEALSSLNPSYRILFENVDKAVDQGDYPNPFPLHLKCLAISSLPMEDVPCVEVWDRRGLIFSSHAGDTPVPDRSNWSAEFGDGFFHVDADVIGDFSVMCRFGGSHALIRDKSTLIFRYQNSTAFLPADVSEMKRTNVDINPEYSDSLDGETFAMHLMFQPAEDPNASGNGEGSSLSALPSVLDPLYTFPTRGKESFEAGLDEISKYHVLEPDPAKFSQLADQDGASSYSTVALQLTGNDVLSAIKLMGQMRQRSADLLSGATRSPSRGGKANTADSLAKKNANQSVRNNQYKAIPFVQPGSKGVSKSGPIARNNMIQTFGEYAGFESTTGMSSSAGGLLGSVGGSRGTGTSGFEGPPLLTLDTDLPPPVIPRGIGQSSPLLGRSQTFDLSPGYEKQGRSSGMGLPRSISGDVGTGSSNSLSEMNTSSAAGTDIEACRVCRTNEYAKRDQLISCTKCHNNFHTHCTGNRRIPFTIKSTKERQSRDKYIQKYYGAWECPDCSAPGGAAKAPSTGGVSGVIASARSDPTHMSGGDSSWSSTFQPSGGVLYSSSGGMGGSSDGPSPVSRSQSSGALAGTSPPKSPIPVDSRRSSISVPRPSPLNTGSISPQPVRTGGGSGGGSGSGSGTGSGVGGPVDDASKLLNVLLSKGITLENLASMSAEDQRSALAAAMVGLGTGSGGGGGPGGGGGGPGGPGGGSGPVLSKGGDVGKYKKMLSMGVSQSAVATCMRADNVDPTVLFGAAAESIGHGAGGGSGAGGSSGSGYGSAGGSVGGMGGPGGAGEGPGGEGSDSGQRVEVDQKYVKYLNLIKVGIPRVSVALKMVSENICSSKEEALRVIDSATQSGPGGAGPGPGGGAWYFGPGNGGGKPGSPSGRGGGNSPGGGGGPVTMIAIKDHPTYAKYFKMLKAGLPEVAVKAKMLQDGLDVAMLEKDPNDTIPYDGPGGGGGGGSGPPEEPKVNLEDHPKYQKYFKMLKVGLPVETVKSKMENEGLNSSVLDMDPLSKVNPNEDVKKSSEAASADKNKIAVKDHPKYAKYFKMLKVGLAKPAVQAKMTQEGVDPTILDKDPNDLIDSGDGEKKEAAGGKKIAAKDHPKYAKYFKMLKVGLAKPAVQAKMTQEGVDPSVLDKNPDDLIDEVDTPASKGAEIAAQDHPKYAKYFKMLKVGLAKPAVQAKMTQEGVDPSVLDKNPTDMIPVDDNPAGAGTVSPKKAIVKEKVRKKKLHWKAIETVSADSVWAAGGDSDDEFKLDEAEFKELFTEKGGDAKQKEVKVAAPASKRASVVTLIDMKRGQNAGIALARIKLTFPQLKERIRVMDSTNLSTDQLRSLEEFLPSAEEKGVLSTYAGEVNMLGKAEQYMLEMMDFKGAVKRIECMIFRQNFSTRIQDIKVNIDKISEACNDVKLSDRLRRVLKVILKVGNQINDGDKQAGFTLDSLLKLDSAKAYDRKTSVLQYIVSLISRNDEGILLFPEDLSNVSPASKVMLDTVATDLTNLRVQWESCRKVVDNIATLNAATAKRKVIEGKSLDENMTDAEKKETAEPPATPAAAIAAAFAAKKKAKEEKATKGGDAKGDKQESEKEKPSAAPAKEDSGDKKPAATAKDDADHKKSTAGVQSGENGTDATGEKKELTEDEGVEEMSKFLDAAKDQCQTLEKTVNDTKAKYKSVLSYFAADEKMASQDFFSTLSKFIQMFVETREVVERLRRAEEKKAKLESNAAAALLARSESGESDSKPVAKKPMRRSSAIVTSTTAVADLMKKNNPATRVELKNDDAVAKEAEIPAPPSILLQKSVTMDAESVPPITNAVASNAPKDLATAGKMKSVPNAAMRRKSTFS